MQDRVLFEVWGSRGSRNLVPPRSAIGNYTASYSLLEGADLFVFDAGRGIDILSAAVRSEPRFRKVKRVHILISHSHMDHWEGLKDTEWMWQGSQELSIAVFAPEQALRTIQRGYDHPAYVALERLAAVAGQSIEFHAISADRSLRLGEGEVTTFPLHHFSGYQHDRSVVETVGYAVRTRGGATAAYFSDHMPAAHTVGTEARILAESRLAVFDAHYKTIEEQNFGHGSQEYAAEVARRHPRSIILAGHHGATLTDEEILFTARRFGAGVPNFSLAVEGSSWEWDGEELGWSASTESGQEHRRPLIAAP